MRLPFIVLIMIVSFMPWNASAQPVVTMPAAGAAASYRTTTISWEPIPGASSYHLEVDDDPNFGSPEVDVTVAGTSYRLSGERLELHGQQSWAAYVRINGNRWNANTFTPSHWKRGREPKLAVDSHSRVYLAFQDTLGIQLTTSSDWSTTATLSHDSGSIREGHNIAADEYDVVHASWIEHGTAVEPTIPFYTKSSTAWNVVQLPGVSSYGNVREVSIVAAAGQVDLFYEATEQAIIRWTSTNGVDFTGTTIPNTSLPTSVSAARDAVGDFYLVSESSVNEPFNDLHTRLQSSSDGWTPHRLGPGRVPSLAVTPSGEVHVLQWGTGASDVAIFYSNSLRGFETWTELPFRSPSGFGHLMPLVIDQSGKRLYTAISVTGSVRLCVAPYGGSAIDTGTSWTCRLMGGGVTDNPDLTLAPDGTLHLAWHDVSQLEGGGIVYANSLGSFAATNLTPQVNFGTPSGEPSAVTVPVTISDADGDEMAGHIQVGRYQPVKSLIEPGTSEKILNDGHTVWNTENSYISGEGQLQFRVIGGTTWLSYLDRGGLALPAQVEVRYSTGEILGGFFIASWDAMGVTIVQNGFVPYHKLTFSGALPAEIDISPLPDGPTMLAIGVSDRVTSSFGAQSFTKASGQTRLVLTKP